MAGPEAGQFDILERSSSVLLVSPVRVGKINKQLDLGCHEYEAHFSPRQREVWHAVMRPWLVEYAEEHLTEVLQRLPMDAQQELRAIFPNPQGKKVYWMPNLVSVCAEKAGNPCNPDEAVTMRNEIKTLDIKVTSQDMSTLKSRPVMYQASGVMIDDLKVSRCTIDSIYMKRVFNNSIKNQSKLTKMFLLDLDMDDTERIKGVFNLALGWNIYMDLYALAKSLQQRGMPTLHKYSILVIRNAESFVVKLIDIEHRSSLADPRLQARALETILEFWRLAIHKKMGALVAESDDEHAQPSSRREGSTDADCCFFGGV